MDGKTAVALEQMGDHMSMLSRIMAVQLGPAMISLTEWILTKLAEAKGAKAGFTTLATEMTERGITKEPIGAFSGSLHALIFRYMPEGMLRAFYGKQFEPMLEAIVAAGEVNSAVTGEGLAALEKLRAAIGAEAGNLGKRNPLFPTFDEDSPNTTRSRGPNIPTDSLVRVGNFLGSAPNAINRIQQRQLEYARQTAANTQRIADRMTAGGRNGVEFPT
jgi:hypothetical protein